MGAPFIFHDIFAYLSGAFRGFGDLQHKWSVNWKFLPTDVFMDKRFAILLLLLHVTVLILFANYRWCREVKGLSGLRKRLTSQGRTLKSVFSHLNSLFEPCSCTLSVSSSQDRHFQFYTWYWHALPVLLWSADVLPVWSKLILLLMFEYAWSYGLDKVEGTSTFLSSLVLQIAHFTLLLSLWFSKPAKVFLPVDDEKKKKKKK